MKAVVIVGAARSGTKMLGNVFNQDSNVSYFGEVNHIWRTGNENIPHDMLPLNQENVKEIRAKFEKNFKDGTVLVEKTAANSLRLPLVKEVFEDVKFIHIVRDGRDVALSASQKWQGLNSKFESEKLKYADTKTSILKRVLYRMKETGPKEFKALIPKGFNMLLSFLGIKKDSYWGPLVPGIREVRKSHSLLETCAYQWRVQEDSILNYFANNKGDVITVYYEELCTNPEEALRNLYNFCEMEAPENLGSVAKTIKIGNLNKWEQELNNENLSQIQTISGELLSQHNYHLV